MERADRQSNFELLRILSILFIILHHIAVHGNWGNGGVFFPEEITFNAMFLQCILPLGKIGVDVFVLISGYFLISSSRCTWPKIFMLWAEMLFYSVLISGLFVLYGGTELSPRQILNVFLPFLSYTWWFASSYLIMLALSPFLNKMICACDEKAHIRLIIGMLALWTAVPAVTGISLQYNEVIWFMVLYTAAAYIRLYPDRFRRRARTYLSAAAVVYGVLMAIAYCIDVTGYTSEFWGIHNFVDHNNMMNSPFAFVISVCLLLAFSRIDIGRIRAVNAVSATVFGIYLIHDHPLVRQWLYSDFFDCLGHTYSGTMFLYVLFMAGTVFAVCSIIEAVRSAAMDRLIRRAADRLPRLSGRLDACLERILGEKRRGRFPGGHWIR